MLTPRNIFSYNVYNKAMMATSPAEVPSPSEFSSKKSLCWKTRQLVSIEYHYAAARHSDHPDPSEQRQTVRIHHADDHGAGERLARRALLTSSMLLLATSRSSSSAVLCWR